MVLCAGLGTRLRPLTEELPKPLVPVGDRSVLDHIAGRLLCAGIDSIVVNVHHLPERFGREIDRLPLEATIVHEPVIRGTAGGLAGARQRLGPGPVVAWNGDMLVDPPLAQLLARVGSGLCLAVAPRPAGEGTVGLGDGARVVRLRGERFGEEVRGGDYVGVAALGPRCLETLPEFGCLIGDWALPELRGGGTVTAVDAAVDFTDMGDPQRYLQANLDWLRENGDERRVWMGPEAQIGDAVALEQAAVGAGARIEGAGALRRCVVWPGARAQAPLHDCVVTTAGGVVRVAG